MRFSRPSGYSPSSSWERVVRKSSGTLWVGVTVSYPHTRGAQQGIPVPIPWEHPRRQAGRVKVALPLRPGSELSAAVPEVAVPVPITRSDNQLPSAAVTSPGSSGPPAFFGNAFSFPAHHRSGAHTRGFPGFPHLLGVFKGLNLHFPWISG